MTNRRNPHTGSKLDDLLEEDGSLADAHALAIKRVLAWRVGQTMSDRRVSKSEMADAWAHTTPASAPRSRSGTALEGNFQSRAICRRP